MRSQPAVNPIAISTSTASQPILKSRGGEFGLKFRFLNGKYFLLAIDYLVCQYEQASVN